LLRIGSDAGSARIINAFLMLCGQASTADCAFSAGTAAKTRAKFEVLLARLRKHAVTLGSGASAQVIGYAKLLGDLPELLEIVQPFNNAQIPDASSKGWSGTGSVLEQLWEGAGKAPSRGSARGGLAHAVASSGANTVQPYSGPEQSLAVICADSPNPRQPSAYSGLAKLVLRRVGPGGLSNLWGDEPCATWPARAPVTYRGPWDKPTANPILVIGNTFDPATPYRGAVAMARQLARARLLSVDGYGHTALLNPSSCVNHYESRYFIKGTLPPKGSRCRQDRQPFSPGR
jgi:hypothetical protein